MPELALLRFVVLDDDYIGDDFIGQYTVPFECLQPGYRSVPLLGMAGDQLPHSSLFVHVAITNRRGGGKAQRRGLSVRRVGKRGREYVTLRHTGIKVLDEAFKPAGVPLKEATDLREDAQVRPGETCLNQRRRRWRKTTFPIFYCWRFNKNALGLSLSPNYITKQPLL